MLSLAPYARSSRLAPERARPTPRPHTRLGLPATSRSECNRRRIMQGSRPVGKHVSRHIWILNALIGGRGAISSINRLTMLNSFKTVGFIAFRSLLLRGTVQDYYEYIGDDVVERTSDDFGKVDKPLWLNLGYWENAKTFPEA